MQRSKRELAISSEHLERRERSVSMRDTGSGGEDGMCLEIQAGTLFRDGVNRLRHHPKASVGMAKSYLCYR